MTYEEEEEKNERHIIVVDSTYIYTCTSVYMYSKSISPTRLIADDIYMTSYSSFLWVEEKVLHYDFFYIVQGEQQTANVK